MSDEPTEDTREAFELVIFLTSGQTLTVDINRLELSRSPLTNSLVSISWDTPADTTEKTYRRLKYLPIENISALYIV